jgi:predicted transposase/invertase (TIGR01784 family)
MNINPHAESRLLRELSANAYRDIKNGMDAAKREGMEKGIAIGTEKGIQLGAQAKVLEVARKMKARGLEEEMISEMTGLPVVEIRKL